eukprot:CAMPEP_0183796168 /NCGR_PEP_ID=MMETSP0803_2-20130417/8813_1 /TAXON_ID=195967 /ORGANISM="Crustomastix stigmata, Strain CCMP3273" /LENGTH=535 /DNA_ID=CAMNT_0026040785 /DNA_START=106 /DNA_END=1713 /DNA_ORIENTATION=-
MPEKIPPLRKDLGALQTQLKAVGIVAVAAVFLAGVCLIDVTFIVYYTSYYVLKFQNESISYIPLCTNTLNSQAIGAAWFGQPLENAVQYCISSEVVNRNMWNLALLHLSAFLCCIFAAVFPGFGIPGNLRKTVKAALTTSVTLLLFAAFSALLYYFSNPAMCWSGTAYQHTLPNKTTGMVLENPNGKLRPPCFKALELYQALNVLSMFVFSCMLSSMMHESLTHIFSRIASHGCFTGVVAIYGYNMPEAYRRGSDYDKLVYRVLVHTVAMELASAPARANARRCLESGSQFFLVDAFLPERFSSMYSRLLVNSVTDDTTLAITCVLLSVVEVGMRLSVFQRDQIIRKVTAKLLGRKQDAIRNELVAMYRKSTIILQSVSELADVLLLPAFFCLILQSDGPLQYQSNQLVARESLRAFGFKVENFIIKNLLIQYVTEIATDVLLALIEYQLGVDIFTVFAQRQQVIKLYGVLILISFFLSHFFFTLIFLYPVFKTKSIGDQHQTKDLEGTWIFYLTNEVETIYAQEYMKNLEQPFE